MNKNQGNKLSAQMFPGQILDKNPVDHGMMSKHDRVHDEPNDEDP